MGVGEKELGIDTKNIGVTIESKITRRERDFEV